jgi:hypothetical protein
MTETTKPRTSTYLPTYRMAAESLITDVTLSRSALSLLTCCQGSEKSVLIYGVFRHIALGHESRRPGARQTPRLVAVELEEKAVPKVNAIEVVLARGRRVEVRPGFDVATLQALIAVLEGV